MGIMSWISQKIDSAVTTVKEWVAPESTSKVSATEKPKPKENVPMVSEETQAAQKNEDKVEIKSKTAESVYKQIEEICAEYKMSMEDVKKAKLLEGILGCSTEELVKKSDEEIKTAIEALQFTLSWQSWVLPFQSRDMDDIKEIMGNANKKYIALKTGRGCWSDMVRWSTPLADRLKDAGYNEVNKENVERYFEDLIRDAIATGDKEKICEAYTEALKTFGDILNDTEDANHKEILTAAISKLQASARAMAAELSITSCGNNQEAKACVARGIASNYVAMSCTADALGERPSADDNTKISITAFQHMTEEDSIAALKETKEYNDALLDKIQNGEPLTEEEEFYLNSARVSYYSGSIIGACLNVTYPSPDNILNTIDTDTGELGIRSEVYSAAASYVANNQDSLPITTQQFSKKVDKATNGNYTAVLNSASAGVSNTHCANKAIKYQVSSTTINQNQRGGTTASGGTNNPEVTQGEQTLSGNISVGGTTTPISGDTTLVSKDTGHAATGQRHSAKGEEAVPEQHQENQNSGYVSADIANRNKAIQGGVKAVKQYAKDNNISTLELAIDSLNSSFASSSTRKWALAQFEAASNSEQLLNFHKITHSSSALAAAQTMDEKTRSQLNTFRSYYIKEAVENISETEIA